MQTALGGTAAPIRQVAVHRTDASPVQERGNAPVAAPTTPAPVAPRGRVYRFRGALGPIFSTGMDKLAERLTGAGLKADVYEFTICRLVAQHAISTYREEPAPIVLIGHSMGGLCSIIFAEMFAEEKIPVSLVVTIDSAQATGNVPLNVERFINIFLSKDVLGGGDIKPVAGFPGHYASYDLDQHDEVLHINIEKMDAVHQQLIAKIMEICATPAKTDDEIVQLRYVVPPKEPIELWDSGTAIAARPGDTLQTLAAEYHVPLWSLRQANPTPGDNAPLVPGQRVTVPRHLTPVAPIAQPVASGR